MERDASFTLRRLGHPRALHLADGMLISCWSIPCAFHVSREQIAGTKTSPGHSSARSEPAAWWAVPRPVDLAEESHKSPLVLPQLRELIKTQLGAISALTQKL